MGRDQNSWQRDIRKATGPFNGNILNSNRDFTQLFAELRKATAKYLRKKKNLTPVERDNHLRSLIDLIPDKPIGILACATELTRSSLRSLLASESGVQLDQDANIAAHLRAIEAVNKVNPYAVDSTEVRKVQALKRLLDRSRFDFLANLHAYYAIEGAGNLEDLFPHSFIPRLLKNLCSAYGETLERYRVDCDWASAQAITSQLSGLLNSSHAFRMALDSVLPTWPSWASWRPNKVRISAWARLSRIHRKGLYDVLALDGPDFIFETHRSLFDAFMTFSREHGVPDNWNNSFITHMRNVNGDPVEFTYHVLQYLCTICASPEAMEVFIYFYRHPRLDTDNMKFLGYIQASGKTSLFSSLSAILTSEDVHIKLRGMSRMLIGLSDREDPGVLEFLSQVFKSIAETGVRDMREKVCLAFENGRDPRPTLQELSSLRDGLKANVSIKEALNPEVLEFLENLPTALEIDALLDLRNDASKNGKREPIFQFIDHYCRVQLAGEGIHDETSQSLIHALTPIWHKPSRAQRKALALLIVSCDTLSNQIRCQCLYQVKDMEENYVRKIDAIIRNGGRGAYMACSEFVSLLLLKGFQRKHDQECWSEVLLWMIENQGPSLPECTLLHMDMTSWLAWLEHLRSILGSRMERSHATLLQPHLHRWSERLKLGLASVITLLDEQHIPGSLKQWILLGQDHQDVVLKMLVTFSVEQERCLRLLQQFVQLAKENNTENGRTWATMAQLINEGQ